MLDGRRGEESVVGCDNDHYVDQTTLNVARGGEITNPSLLILVLGFVCCGENLLYYFIKKK